MSDSPLVPILRDQNRPFYINPEEIIDRMHYTWLRDLDAGHSAILDSLIPHLEMEAVHRFKKEITHAHDWEPKLTDGYEAWRMFWLNEARHNCKVYNLLGVANDHLSKICQSALNVMLAASALRDAISEGKAEQASALGILLICEAIQGGYSLEFDAMREAKEALDKAKKNRVHDTIGKQHGDMTKARNACVSKAKQMWNEDQTLRIGRVAEECQAVLLLNIKKLPSMTARDIPDIPTIKNWFKDAAAAKKLTIPEDAQKPGRPKGQSGNKS